jgi:hypothetical protein
VLTLFTAPKPFRGHIGIIQRNAILSWLKLRPSCEVILFGDEEGTAELAAKFGVRHVPDFNRNEYGTPLLDRVFETAQELASNELMVYINADIILLNDIFKAVSLIQLNKFLMIGQRWDLDIKELLDFDNPDWEARLRDMIREYGILHPPSGVDYYLFPKGLFGKIPPFAIGRTAYDNWFIYKIRSLGIPVIDATRLVTNIHQNHERTYASVGLQGPQGEKDLTKGVEHERNIELAGGSSHLFSLQDANWILTPQGLKRARSIRHLYFQTRAFTVLNSGFSFLLVFFKLFEKALRAPRFIWQTAARLLRGATDK